MLDLKAVYGKRVKVTLEESWEGGDKTAYWIVKGKRGDVMAWDDQSLEVTVYGRPLKIAPGVLPNKTHRLQLPDSLERSGWKAKNHYDDSICFLVPAEWATKAFRVIKARNRRQVTESMRQRGRELAALNQRKNETPC